jgi:hypothetical protein
VGVLEIGMGVRDKIIPLREDVVPLVRQFANNSYR